MNSPSPLETVFFGALAKGSPQERAAYLDDACAGDPDLRRRVEKMLAAQAQAGSFLEQPAADLSSPASATASAGVEPGPTLDQQPVLEQRGTVIGPYKLIEPIGEGGMGTVWMAQQTEPVKRLVAVKLIKAGMDSKQVIARFEAERQALALMDHPNIARVLEAGATSTGRPYFVMDLVKGVPITRYCDEHHLTPRQRLELFIPICQAVQHAHQKGIIHRDLKPSNVLVALYDGKPVPKVIDFGVAKAARQTLTEKTLVTGFGAIVGTLEYMSPEQAEINQLDIDTRSDIYSLGVLLYELLAGSPPFTRKELTQAGMLELLRVIREQEPSKPSTKLSTAEGLPTLAANRGTDPAKLTKLVRGELDWIVMKALEKDRERRYETANEFSLDLQRYLADEPVQACPPSAGYRLRKFVRRNRGPVMAVSLVLLALVAGIIGTAWGLVRAERARQAEADRADGERRAKDEAQKAAEAERKAREAETAQRLRAEGSAKLALTVLNDLIKHPEQEKQARESLENGLRYYEQLAQTSPADWAARRERAKAYAYVGLLQMNLRNHVESEKAYRQAVQFMEELAGERPDDFDNAYDLANTYYSLSRPYWDTGRLQPAEEVARRALVLFDKLAADFPDRPWQGLEGRVNCRRSLAVVLQKAGKPQEAENAFQQSLAICAEWAAASPDTPEPRHAEATIHYEMAQIRLILKAADQLDKAEQGYRHALDIWQKLATQWPDRGYGQNAAGARGQIAHVDWDRGFHLRSADKPREAEECYRRANAIFEELVAVYPAEAFYRQELATSYRFLAWLLRDTGRLQEAEKPFRQALALHEKLVTELPAVTDYRVRLAQNFGELTDNLLQQGKHAEAAQVAEKIPEALPKDASAHQRAAAVFARCVPLAEKDAKLAPADRKGAALAYLGRCRDFMREALNWLRADLAAWSQLLEKEPDQARARVQQQLRHWKQDPDFAGVRGDALAKLPEAEQQAWQQLWADLEQTLKRVNEKDTKDSQKKSPE